MKPAVSVCMPVYNRAAYIEECVESILAQTFTDFELVIVDDGSTDGTCELIRSFRDPRIRLIQGAHDISPPATGLWMRRGASTWHVWTPTIS